MGNHTYTPNALNQYSAIGTGTTRTAVGRAPISWNVLVAGSAASRMGEIFHRQMTASNGSSPVWQTINIQRDTGSPSSNQNFWYSAASVAPSDDFDGNLLNDGRWVYTWDAENRLIQMETTSQATTAGHPYTKLQFVNEDRQNE